MGSSPSTGVGSSPVSTGVSVWLYFASSASRAVLSAVNVSTDASNVLFSSPNVSSVVVMSSIAEVTSSSSSTLIYFASVSFGVTKAVTLAVNALIASVIGVKSIVLVLIVDLICSF